MRNDDLTRHRTGDPKASESSGVSAPMPTILFLLDFWNNAFVPIPFNIIRMTVRDALEQLDCIGIHN
jgi:hypothetical protein